MRILWGSKVVDQLASNAVDGTTFVVQSGTYWLTVTGEDIEIRLGTAIAQGEGTPHAIRSSIIIDVPADESWAIRSAGGTGRLVLTRAG